MSAILTKEIPMKPFALALLAGATVLAANSAFAHTSVNFGVQVGAPAYIPAPPPAVVYAPAPEYCPPPVVHYVPSRGHWESVMVKTWVPARWVATRDNCGRSVRVYERGYFTYRNERVWVDGYGRRG
jgi:hypothetical protein